MATGDLGYMAVSVQNSLGTITRLWLYQCFVSETMAWQMDRLMSECIQASLVEGAILQGINRAQGDVVVEPCPRGFGYWLRGVFGQSSSAANGAMYDHTFNFRLADFCEKTPLPPVYTASLGTTSGTTRINNPCYDGSAGLLFEGRSWSSILRRIHSRIRFAGQVGVWQWA